MSELARGRLAIKYILLETLPTFFVGLGIFLFILLMFQALRLTEFVLVHGVSLKTTGQIMGFLAISFLPVILPMSVLFSILITYGRLSHDMEIAAFKSLGLTLWHLIIPAVILGLSATFASMQIAYYLAPWGNRQFEVLIADLGKMKASAALKEGVFSEGFFDLVIYANQIDSKAGILNKVFIYDERDPNSPLTIIAAEGRIVREMDPKLGDRAHLQLRNGSIHHTRQDTYTKIDFTGYDIKLFTPADQSETSKSMPSMSIDEVRKSLAEGKLNNEDRIHYQIEALRRSSVSWACLIFSLIGVGLGTSTNRRMVRSGGMVLCLMIIVAYWMCYLGAEGLSQGQYLPASFAIWGVNVLFSGVAYWALRRAQAS